QADSEHNELSTTGIRTDRPGRTMDRFHRRHLPHEIPDDVPLFITWNLKGALPAKAIVKLKEERDRLQRQPARVDEAPTERTIRESKIVFALTDKELDAAASGPMHLKDTRAAKIVEDAILFGCKERYELYAWCVMANHVHVLLKPIWPLDEV